MNDFKLTFTRGWRRVFESIIVIFKTLKPFDCIKTNLLILLLIAMIVFNII